MGRLRAHPQLPNYNLAVSKGPEARNSRDLYRHNDNFELQFAVYVHLNVNHTKTDSTELCCLAGHGHRCGLSGLDEVLFPMPLWLWAMLLDSFAQYHCACKLFTLVANCGNTTLRVLALKWPYLVCISFIKPHWPNQATIRSTAGHPACLGWPRDAPKLYSPTRYTSSCTSRGGARAPLRSGCRHSFFEARSHPPSRCLAARNAAHRAPCPVPPLGRPPRGGATDPHARRRGGAARHVLSDPGKRQPWWR